MNYLYNEQRFLKIGRAGAQFFLFDEKHQFLYRYKNFIKLLSIFELLTATIEKQAVLC